MKKLLLMFLLGVSCSVMAAYTAKFTLNIASVGGGSDKVILREGADFSADFDNGYEATDQPNSGLDENINLYAICTWAASQHACELAEFSLEGVKLEFQANKIANDPYTITFSNVSGTQYYLKDNMVKSVLDPTKDSLTAIVTNGTYTFTQTKETTEERFEIVSNELPNYKRQQAVGNWGTISLPWKITSVEGADMYKVYGKNAAATKLGYETVSTFVAGEAYLFQATDAEQVFYYDEDTEVSSAVATNGMYGIFGAAGWKTDAEYWLLVNNQIVLSAAQSTVGQYRAYIKPSEVPEKQDMNPAPGRKIFNIDNAATGMEMIKDADLKDGKVMIDGKLIIIRDGKMFNAQGAAL